MFCYYKRQRSTNEHIKNCFKCIYSQPKSTYNHHHGFTNSKHTIRFSTQIELQESRLDKIQMLTHWIQPETNNYERFIGLVTKPSKTRIPKGFRKEYIPG